MTYRTTLTLITTFIVLGLFINDAYFWAALMVGVAMFVELLIDMSED